MKQITLKDWWLAVDCDGSLRLHEIKPERTTDDRTDIEYWESNDNTLCLYETWAKTNDLLGIKFASQICDNPMKVTITLSNE